MRRAWQKSAKTALKIWFSLGCGVLATGAASGAPQEPATQQAGSVSHETPYKAKPSAPLPKRERAWEVLREGLAENSAEKRAKAVSALAAC